MPRTLNVEKLDKKFASLTRSRESIQGLSSWIMHHKEFYQEIVEEWLNALKKDDFNALNMFYVANDVIQHCGKKKVPEYRTAFSTVLEKALSLAKVKEIKNEVTRMMTLWHDKEIYDDDFFQQLENTLNNEPPTPEISDEEKDLSDAEIVSIFKLQNLIDALENLKRITNEVSCKEAKLKNMKCPENLNVEDLIVRMDKKDTYKQYKKADAYCKYVDDLIASFILLNDAREDALKYLKYTTVFYTTQNEEVKKVVHAYRIYGKKLKIMEKALSEKMSGLRELFPSPIPESPISDNSIEFSLPSDSPTLDSNPELVNTVDDSQNSPSSNTECTEDSSHEIYVPGESPSENAEVTESICLKDAGSLSATDEKDVPNIEVTSFDVPFRQEDSDISDEKSNVDSNIMDSELKVKSDVATPAEGDSTDIDFLLEKAYDERKGKKANIKRKIENLLKAKGSKACKVSDSEKGDQHESNESKLPTKAVIATVEDNNNGSNFENPMSEIVNKAEKLQVPPFLDADKVSEKDTVQTDNIIDFEQEKESQDQDVSKIDDCQSRTLKMDTDADEENSVPKICAPAQQTLSQIPLELLKSLLDKNILNTCSSQETVFRKEDNSCEKVCVADNAACTIKSEKQEEIPCIDVKPDKSVMQTESSQNALAESATSCEELTKFKEENQLLEEITDKIDKESTVIESNLPSFIIESTDTKKLSDAQCNKSLVPDNVSKTEVLDNAKSSNFLETLGTTLKCLTANNLSLPQFKGTEKQMSESGFSVMALEHSLRLYNFLLQCHQAVENKEDYVDNVALNKTEAISTVPSTENLDVCVNSNKVPENALGNIENSKHDNLELMDMDVDSEDDS